MVESLRGEPAGASLRWHGKQHECLHAKCLRRDAPAHLKIISRFCVFALVRELFEFFIRFWTSSVEVFISKKHTAGFQSWIFLLKS